MWYLICAICCSASIALIFKHSETSGMNRYGVTSANYLTACLVSAGLLLAQGFELPLSDMYSAFGDLRNLISGEADTASPGTSFARAILIGLLAGGIFFLAFVYYQIGVNRHGVSLTGAFAKLGILIPMSFSLILWKESPSTVQWVGIGLAVFSIVLVNRPTDGDLRKAIRPALLLLFLFGGLAEFSNKIFQHYGLLEHKTVFLLTTFSVAFVSSVITTRIKSQKITRRDLLTGVAVGVPNLFSSYFLILALDTVPATVAFPVYSAGSIVVINVVGAAFFKERLRRAEQIAIVLTCLGLILIDIR